MTTAADPEVGRPPVGILIPDVQDAVIVRPSRELDCSSGPELIRHFGRVLRSTRNTTIEVPLDTVEFVDAAGMRSLVECRGLALRSRRDVRFTQPSLVVRRLLALLGELDLPLEVK
jgi:anti-anti-sigma factor